MRLQSLLLLGSASATLVVSRAPLQSCVFADGGGRRAACVARLVCLALGVGFLLPAAIVYAAEDAARRRFLRRRSSEVATSPLSAAAATAPYLGKGADTARALPQAAAVC